MELWIPITIVAAFLQNVRSLMQKQLTGALSVNGASYVRFLYALPFAWAYLLILSQLPDQSSTLGGIDGRFLAYCLMGSVGQIVGTAALVASFTHRNFAVGTAFSKTEAMQAAVFGLVVLEDLIDARVAGGIAVSLVGVVLLSANVRLKEMFSQNGVAGLGILAGAGFAIAAVGFRGASLALPEGDFIVRAATTLAMALTMQTLIMGVYLKIREPGEITRVSRVWRRAVWVGVTGAAASACWFSAMTIQTAALVRALGQIELIFTFATSVWIFREKIVRREVFGVVWVVAGLYLLIG
ncbi:MAG: EamA family transporter [Proteobacteria bacterium]|nr:EamA family transporter [Pseudomonadota bacterium]